MARHAPDEKRLNIHGEIIIPPAARLLKLVRETEGVREVVDAFADPAGGECDVLHRVTEAEKAVEGGRHCQRSDSLSSAS